MVRSCLLVALAAALLSSSCGPSAGTSRREFDAACTDCDGDGYVACLPGQDAIKMGCDCNDNDKRIHPGAPELCLKAKDGTPQPTDFNCNRILDDICDDDKDGWAICGPGATDSRCGNVAGPNNLPGGDCRDNDPLYNPGAYDFPGTKTDYDCDSPDNNEAPDPPCDLNTDPKNPMSFAGAMELCTPWVLSASFNNDADLKARAIRTQFGYGIKPNAGKSFIMLSNGLAVDETDPGYNMDWWPQPGTPFSNVDDNPLVIKTQNVCQPGQVIAAPPKVNDMTSFTLTIKVPTNAQSFSFDFYFFSSEYPEYVGNQYNDGFLAVLNSKHPLYQGKPANISFDAKNNPITVDNSFFSVCKDEPICSYPANGNCNGGACNPMCVNCTNCPSFCGHTCPMGPGALDGTGYELGDPMLGGEPLGGGTGWLTTTAPVQPGETITLTFAIFDAGDHLWDSSVLIDNFRWLINPSAAPCTATPDHPCIQ